MTSLIRAEAPEMTGGRLSTARLPRYVTSYRNSRRPFCEGIKLNGEGCIKGANFEVKFEGLWAFLFTQHLQRLVEEFYETPKELPPEAKEIEELSEKEYEGLQDELIQAFDSPTEAINALARAEIEREA